MSEKMIYVRTDKNGTKIYHDFTCQRCGGAGGADQWAYTGWTCYECGGSGEARKARVVKIYTPEYQEKLNAKAIARAKKRDEERKAKFNAERVEMIMALGFNADGKLYAVLGNTFEIKDELKADGARWIRNITRWCFTEPSDKYETFELTADELLDINEEYGTINWKSSHEIIDVLKSKSPSTKNTEWYGEVGDKIKLELTLVGIYGYTTKYAYRDISHFIYKFTNADGNVFVWNTTSWNDELFDAHNNGREDVFIVSGSIKNHGTYNDEKQTELQRCKIEKKER